MPTVARPAQTTGSGVVAAVGLYLLVRAVGVLVLWWYAATHDASLSDALTKWDGQWLLGIAEHGYRDAPHDLVDATGRRTPDTAFAFFPGYPLLLAAVASLPWISVFGAAIGVSVVSGATAAAGLARLSRTVTGSARAGLLMVVLFAAAPMAVVLSMTYTEALFCALAVWALNGVLERRWVLAGGCTALAGLVRPTAAALVLVVVAAAVVVLIRRRDGWWPWAGILLSPVGLLAYLGWVGWQTHDLFGWFALESTGWHSGFDGGLASWHYVVQQISAPGPLMDVVSVLVVLATAGLVVLGVLTRLPWLVLLYGAGVTVMAVASDGLMPSKPRLLLPAAVLLLPVAVGLAKRGTTTQIAVVIAVVLASAWLGAYALIVYPYAI